MKDSFDEFYSEEEISVNQPHTSSLHKSPDLKQPNSAREYVEFLNFIVENEADKCGSTVLNRYLDVILGARTEIQQIVIQNEEVIKKLLHICIVRAVRYS